MAHAHGSLHKPREVENGQGRQSRKQAHHRHRALDAGERIGRQQEHREPWSVNRINLPIQAASQIVRLERPAEKCPVVSACVVIFNLEIVIDQQAVGNHEVVRLVSAESHHSSD